MRILLATPSRGRPDVFKRMVKSARATATDNANLSIVAMIDLNDSKRKGYLKERGYTVMQGKRRRLPLLWNEIVDNNRYDIVMMCADDLIFRTTGWDDEVRAAFAAWPDRIGMVYTDDGLHGEKLATHSFVSREWVEAVGYYLPESLYGDFVDNFIHTLAASIDRVAYLPRVFIEHMHPYAGKAAMDDTYRYRLTASGPALAQEAWENLLQTEKIPSAIKKLEEAMDERTRHQ